MTTVSPTWQNLLDLVVVVISLTSLGPDQFPASVIRSLRAFRVQCISCVGELAVRKLLPIMLQSSLQRGL